MTPAAAPLSLMPRTGSAPLRCAGLREAWLLPLAVWDAPQGFDSRSRPDNRPYHALAWRLSGSLVRRVLPSGQLIEELAPQGFSVHPAGSDLRFVAAGPIRYAHYYLPTTQLRRVAVELLGERGDRDELLSARRVMFSDAGFTPLLDAYLRRGLDADDAPTRLEMDSRAQLLLLRLLQQHAPLTRRGGPAPRGRLAAALVRRCCEQLQARLAEDLPLAALADELGVSYHHLIQGFRKATGLAPHQWLCERRVERAAELLRAGSLPVTEVAAAVGYADPNQLARQFRRRRGLTPSQYRRAMRLCAG